MLAKDCFNDNYIVFIFLSLDRALEEINMPLCKW